jgi:hypothetical protein
MDLQNTKKIEKGEYSGEKCHFDGTKAGSVVMNIETGSSAPEVMTSDELLNRMRKRIFIHKLLAFFLSEHIF